MKLLIRCLTLAVEVADWMNDSWEFEACVYIVLIGCIVFIVAAAPVLSPTETRTTQSSLHIRTQSHQTVKRSR